MGSLRLWSSLPFSFPISMSLFIYYFLVSLLISSLPFCISILPRNLTFLIRSCHDISFLTVPFNWNDVFPFLVKWSTVTTFKYRDILFCSKDRVFSGWYETKSNLFGMDYTGQESGVQLTDRERLLEESRIYVPPDSWQRANFTRLHQGSEKINCK